MCGKQTISIRNGEQAIADASGLFNQKAMDKMRSPDEPDKALRIASPGVLAVLFACVALILGFLAWGIFGRITSAVSATGVSIGGKVECFLSDDEMLGVEIGDKANVNGAVMWVTGVSKTPLSREETRDIVDSDYLADRLAVPSGQRQDDLILTGFHGIPPMVIHVPYPWPRQSRSSPMKGDPDSHTARRDHVPACPRESG